MTPEKDTQQEDKIVVHIDADLKELIPGYLNSRYRDIQVMQKALAQGDYDTIHIVGHSMKGSGGGYGFDTITEIGGALEQAAKEGEPDAIRRWMDELRMYLERVQVVYD